jgi:hypothetical protein
MQNSETFIILNHDNAMHKIFLQNCKWINARENTITASIMQVN